MCPYFAQIAVNMRAWYSDSERLNFKNTVCAVAVEVFRSSMYISVEWVVAHEVCVGFHLNLTFSTSPSRDSTRLFGVQGTANVYAVGRRGVAAAEGAC